MITVVGEALIDLVVAADGTLTAAPGGAPFNVARACASLGAPTLLLTALSTDRFGERLLAALAADGVGTGCVQRTEQPTTLAVAELDADGVASYRFYLDGTSVGAFHAATLPADTDALVTGGLALAVEPLATAVERTTLDAPATALVMVDLNCRPAVVGDRDAYVERLRRVVARADVVKASVEDLAYVEPGTSPERTARHLVDTGPRVVLLTAGPDPVAVVTATATEWVPVAATQVVDTIGAGDTFTAGFLTWWTEGSNPREALAEVEAVAPAVRAAQAVATLVVSRRGAAAPRRHDLPADWAPQRAP